MLNCYVRMCKAGERIIPPSKSNCYVRVCEAGANPDYAESAKEPEPICTSMQSESTLRQD